MIELYHQPRIRRTALGVKIRKEDVMNNSIPQIITGPLRMSVALNFCAQIVHSLCFNISRLRPRISFVAMIVEHESERRGDL